MYVATEHTVSDRTEFEFIWLRVPSCRLVVREQANLTETFQMVCNQNFEVAEH